MHPNQLGFRKNLSTVTQLLEITHDLSTTLHSDLQTDTIFIDFAKAFDRAPHSKLIDKLASFGINSKITTWIKMYLSNRTQYVVVNGTATDLLDAFSGVPQGSVLGPI